MNTCAGVRKRTGERCTASPQPGSIYCWGHDPQLAAKRIEARVRGGQHRATKERAGRYLPRRLQELEDRLVRLCDELEAGEKSPRTVEVIAAVAGRLIELAEFAVKAREQAEVLERLAALEAQAGVRRSA